MPQEESAHSRLEFPPGNHKGFQLLAGREKLFFTLLLSGLLILSLPVFFALVGLINLSNNYVQLQLAKPPANTDLVVISPADPNLTVTHTVTTPLTTATSANQFQVNGILGDSLRGGNLLVSVEELDRADDFNQYLSASDDHTLFAVDMSVVNLSGQLLEVNTMNCALFDSQGQRSYKQVFAGKDPALNVQKSLNRGEKLHGWVTFEIPKGATGFTFIYHAISANQTFDFSFDLG
ncbi:MAG TPA: DUF4352 domain-containing protein [Chloroflexia bacterium]|nr:DUF4352 domain-containing protein [Chloroflexia bacterium]